MGEYTIEISRSEAHPGWWRWRVLYAGEVYQGGASSELGARQRAIVEVNRLLDADDDCEEDTPLFVEVTT